MEAEECLRIRSRSYVVPCKTVLRMQNEKTRCYTSRWRVSIVAGALCTTAVNSEASKSESLLAETSEPEAACASKFPFQSSSTVRVCVCVCVCARAWVVLRAGLEAGYEFQSNGVISMLEKLESQFKEDGNVGDAHAMAS